MTATCWICGAALDAGGFEPLVRVVCRKCGQKICCNEPSIILCLWRRLVPVEWAQCIRRATRNWSDSLRSNCCTRILLAKRIMNGQSQQEGAYLALWKFYPMVVFIFLLGMGYMAI